MESSIKDLIKEIKKIKKGKYDLSQYSRIDSSIEDTLTKEIYNNFTDDDRDPF